MGDPLHYSSSSTTAMRRASAARRSRGGRDGEGRMDSVLDSIRPAEREVLLSRKIVERGGLQMMQASRAINIVVVRSYFMNASSKMRCDWNWGLNAYMRTMT